MPDELGQLVTSAAWEQELETLLRLQAAGDTRYPHIEIHIRRAKRNIALWKLREETGDRNAELP